MDKFEYGSKNCVEFLCYQVKIHSKFYLTKVWMFMFAFFLFKSIHCLVTYSTREMGTHRIVILHTHGRAPVGDGLSWHTVS